MVRLKVANEVVSLSPAYTDFNSSMVRLKVKEPTKELLNQIHFNSSMVRLKVIRPRHRIPTIINFNSSMVRLKGNVVSGTITNGGRFQFLNGAIKSFGWKR